MTDVSPELYQAYRDYDSARAGADQMVDQLQAAQERADRAEAKLARVRELVDSWDTDPVLDTPRSTHRTLAALRHALDEAGDGAS